jgi:hypothetical protein
MRAVTTPAPAATRIGQTTAENRLAEVDGENLSTPIRRHRDRRAAVALPAHFRGNLDTNR